MATQRTRFTVSLEPEMYREVENFRFEERYNTMSKAAENLIMRGLKAFYAEQDAITDQQPATGITVEEAFGKEE